MTAPVSHLLAREHGAWLEVLLDGDPGASAAPVVLLPSSLRDATDLEGLAQALNYRGHAVLRPQPRGMGRSSPPAGDFTLHTLAGDVAWAIERLLGRPAIIAGHAFGHYVARVTDLDHPQWVLGVAVMGAAAREFPAGLTAMLDRAADSSQPVAERLACLQHAFFACGHNPSEWLQGWHFHLRQVYRAAGSIPPKSAWWPVSHAPILDLQAADDPWRPEASRQELRQALGDRVTVWVIEEASHALVAEQPEAVAQALSEWALQISRVGQDSRLPPGRSDPLS